MAMPPSNPSAATTARLIEPLNATPQHRNSRSARTTLHSQGVRNALNTKLKKQESREMLHRSTPTMRRRTKKKFGAAELMNYEEREKKKPRKIRETAPGQTRPLWEGMLSIFGGSLAPYPSFFLAYLFFSFFFFPFLFYFPFSPLSYSSILFFLSFFSCWMF